jgi:hypothetical protein
MVLGTRIAPEDEITLAGGTEDQTNPQQHAHQVGGGRLSTSSFVSKNQVHPSPASPASLSPAVLQAQSTLQIAQARQEAERRLVEVPAQAPSKPAVAWNIATISPDEKRLEAHGEVYIPFRVAKNKVSEVENDMRSLRGKHMRVIEQVESHYRDMARELEQYYLAYIDRLNTAAQQRARQQDDLLAAVQTQADDYRRVADAKSQELAEENTTLLDDVRYEVYLLCWYKSTCFAGTKVSKCAPHFAQ